MKTTVAIIVLCVSLSSWLGVHAALVNAVSYQSDSLRQCDCTGDLFRSSGLDPTRKTEIVITAFFSFRDCVLNNTRTAVADTTYHLIPAAVLAVEEINNASDILTDFHVSLDIRDTKCDGAQGNYQLIQTIRERARSQLNNSLNVAILGPGCSEVSEAIAGVAGRWLNISQVSYGYNLPKLANDRDKYPSFFQTARSIDLTAISTVRLLSYFNWTHNIAVIQDSSDLFTQAVDTVVESSNAPSGIEFRYNNIRIPVNRFAQVTHNHIDADQLARIRTFMTGVEDDNIRVIVGFVSERIATLLLCMTRNVTIPSDGYLFVFVGSMSDQWWTDSTFCRLHPKEVESVIIVSSEFFVSDSSAVVVSGRTVHDFKVDYSYRLRKWCGLDYGSPDPLAAATYDAVWSIARALDDNADLLNISNTLDYQYSATIYEAVLESLHNTNFTGVSGQVQFNDRGERLGIDAVLQVQNGSIVIVGKFKPSKENFVEGEFRWFGNETSIPSDTPRAIDKAVPVYILAIASMFTSTGILFACVMCCFNWHYAKHKILLATSQKLNYVIIAGVLLAFSSTLLLTALESPLGLKISDELFKALCIIRIWILPLSFTLSYGTMFARAWRIYRIFNNPWISKRRLKDYHLMMIVIGLGIVDVLYLVPWTIIDPYRRFISSQEINFREFSQCSYVSCSSSNTLVWLGILTACKFLVIIAGVILISLVQKKVRGKKYFNDSRSLASALYVTALSFSIGVALQLLFTFQGQIMLTYIVGATWVNIASSGTLIGVFMPKVYKIWFKHDRGKGYKTERSIFYLEHPEAYRTAGSITDSVATLNTVNQTVVYDITAKDIEAITGTE